jgi:hypothetical protein
MIPDEIKKRMTENALEVQEGIASDHAPVLKLHTHYGKGIWLLSELDPENNIAFGICDLGQGNPELSYVSIDQLASLRHARLKVSLIEADRLFVAKYPMSVYLHAAKSNKRITEDEHLLDKAAEWIKNKK